MSTNKTANIGLHLWEGTDPFLRTEFNENSEKIDAAVTALAGNKLSRGVVLKTVSAVGRSVSVDVDLTDVDWDRWEYITVTTDRQGELVYGTSGTLILRCSSDGGNTYQTLGVSEGAPPLLVFMPWHDKTRRVQSASLSGGSYACLDASFQALTQLQLTCSGAMKIADGTVITLYAVG